MPAEHELASRLRAALADELPFAVALRHELHANPDPSGREEPTAARVAAAMGAPDAPPVAGTGRLVRVEPAAGPATGPPAGPATGPPAGPAVRPPAGAAAGPAAMPAVAVRAELDALPIPERTGAPFAARNGHMHACGHDVHLAALAALVRAARRVALPVPLLAVLQPREETYPSGARDLAEGGALAPHRVGAFVAAHLHHAVPAGTVTAGTGAVNAAADEFEIVVAGRGGHGAYPHLTDDPIPALAQIVTGLQQLVSRRTDPMRAAVLTVGTLHAGHAANVVPETARATGTLRSTDAGDREALRAGVRRVAEQVAAAFGCTARVTITAGEPVLDNDPRLAAATEAWLSRAGVPVAEPPRSCGSDDFAFYRQLAPTLMMFVGAGTGVPLHSAEFLPPDETVAAVAGAMLAGYLGAVDAIFSRTY